MDTPDPDDLASAARRAEAQLRAVLDSVSDCYYALDRNWTIVEFSRSAELYFGLKREDVVGRNLWDLFPSGRGQAYEDTCRAAMERGERARLEAPSAFRPGNVVEMRTSPMENGISVVVTDITQLKRVEHDFSELTRSLEVRIADAVAEREEALVQRDEAREALFQAQKMDAIGQLAGGIAHDFNNLLQGIIGSLNLIQRRLAQGRTSELERFIEGGIGAANRAAGLTHRLLAYSRRQPLNPKPVAAGVLIGGMEDLLSRTLGELIQLDVLIAEDLWTTLCDASQLENAVLNLAINARDAMPDGGQLTIELCNAVIDDKALKRIPGISAGDYVCLIVTDTGSGMSEDVLKKAFDPFFTTKPLGEGTGLGLSMIYGFAQQSEGTAMISSQVGRGTIVKVYLPRFQNAAPLGETEDAPAAIPAGGGERIIVIEDEPTVRGVVVETLGDLGYSVIAASDGLEGLAILQSLQRIDLLVTDVGLPGLNGRQVADAARLVRPRLKILFMTGYEGAAAVPARTLDADMSLITKPFAVQALAARVRGLLTGEDAH